MQTVIRERNSEDKLKVSVYKSGTPCVIFVESHIKGAGICLTKEQVKDLIKILESVK